MRMQAMHAHIAEESFCLHCGILYHAVEHAKTDARVLANHQPARQPQTPGGPDGMRLSAAERDAEVARAARDSGANR